MSLAGKQFEQMNGLGNKILVVDMRGDDGAIPPQELIAINNTPGLAFDQVMVLRTPRTPGTEAFVHIYNCDGSEAQACGNGTRCVAWHLFKTHTGAQLFVETVAGILVCEKVSEWAYRVDMGIPKTTWNEIPLSTPHDDTTRVRITPPVAHAFPLPDGVCVNMGNPHIVFFVDDVQAVPLAEVGPLIEHHPLFPERVNVSFVHVDSATHLTQRVWERGTGITLACGTGACAALVAAVRTERASRTVKIALPGGTIGIDWRENGHVLLEGPVEHERTGVFASLLS
jgi:diaminopimelate epimerase